MGLLVVSADQTVSTVTSDRRARIYTRTSLAARFWSKVDRNGPTPQHRPELGPCWLWTGSADENGYGQIREAGKHGKLLKAHRVSLALATGPLDDQDLACHACDNPPCVRPEHLFRGDSATNSQDAAAKGRLVFQKYPDRAPRGENGSSAKLTAEQVTEIRTRRENGETQTALAARFGVTQANISAILTGKTWRSDGA